MTGSEQSLSQQPTTADVMQTAEDILDDLDNNWIESTLIKLLT